MSWGNWVRKGSLFNWDFVYGEIPNRLVPFDFEALVNSDTEFKIGTSHVKTGEAQYLSSKEMNKKQLLTALTASSSLPLVSKMVNMDGELYMDGGLADSIPVEKAFADGYGRAVVLLTRNKGYIKKSARFKRLIKLRYRKYPKLVELIFTRAFRYNKTLELLEKMEGDGKVYIIRPQAQMDVSRTENNPHKLDQLYLNGYKEGEALVPDLKQWLANHDCA